MFLSSLWFWHQGLNKNEEQFYTIYYGMANNSAHIFLCLSTATLKEEEIISLIM